MKASCRTTLPAFMNAIEMSGAGGPEVLRVVKRPLPKPGVDEVLVRVAAAGVNRPDVMQRQGKYPPPPGASDIAGLEIAGVVVACGAHVKTPCIGEAVCALVTGGGYAEYCKAHAALCLPIPSTLQMTQAAAVPETFFTVWNNVFMRGALRTGETLLVHGGGSGIGTAAIQLAKAFGSSVIVTAGSEERCTACMQLGADQAINYRDADFVAEVAKFTGKSGVHVILDMIGGDYLARNIRCLAEQGRLVQIALQGGSKGELNLSAVMMKRLTISGSTLRARAVSEKAVIADALREKVWPLFARGTIAPVINRTFRLQEAASAHALMESGAHFGKIVLECDG